MKIIDLLNKIANGEIKLETKFNWHYKMYDIELIFAKRQGALGLYFQQEDRLIGLFERFNYQILNDEVEIIEEEKKIPEKLEEFGIIQYKLDYIDYKNIEVLKEWLNKDFQTIYDTLDLIIKNQNKLIDYLKSKGDE